MDKAYAKIIVNRVRSLCQARGISINKLAEMSGVSQSTLDNFLNGKTFNPRISTLHKIGLAFSMTPAEFFDFPEMNSYSFDDPSDDTLEDED